MKNANEQPYQPPKQAVYDQLLNPVTHSPYEQRLPHPEHPYGEHVSSAAHRTADSQPSSDEAIAKITARHRRQLKEMQSENLDTEYGVELQPTEGEIAAAVEGHSRRALAGVHAGPVRSPQGLSPPAFGEEPDLVANMDRKMRDHGRILENRAGRSLPDGETVEREALRQRRLKQDHDLHVQQAVREATGDPVVG